MNDELKPCPFCGEEARKMESLLAFVFCPKCGIVGPKYLHMNEAIEHWNTRISDNTTGEDNDNGIQSYKA